MREATHLLQRNEYDLSLAIAGFYRIRGVDPVKRAGLFFKDRIAFIVKRNKKRAQRVRQFVADRIIYVVLRNKKRTEKARQLAAERARQFVVDRMTYIALRNKKRKADDQSQNIRRLGFYSVLVWSSEHPVISAEQLIPPNSDNKRPPSPDLDQVCMITIMYLF